MDWLRIWIPESAPRKLGIPLGGRKEGGWRDLGGELARRGVGFPSEISSFPARVPPPRLGYFPWLFFSSTPCFVLFFRVEKGYCGRAMVIRCLIID